MAKQQNPGQTHFVGDDCGAATALIDRPTCNHEDCWRFAKVTAYWSHEILGELCGLHARSELRAMKRIHLPIPREERGK